MVYTILLTCFYIFSVYIFIGFLSGYTVSFLINKNKELYKAKKQISRKLSFLIFIIIIATVIVTSIAITEYTHLHTVPALLMIFVSFCIVYTLITFLTFMIVYKDSIPIDVSSKKVRKVKKTIYLRLLLFLGFVGAHRFYLKNYKRAFLMLFLSFLFFSVFIIRTMIRYAMMHPDLRYQDWDLMSLPPSNIVKFLIALQGPFGGLLMILTLYPLITLIIYDFLQVRTKKADENGYIDI